MAFNPANQEPSLNNSTQRANALNDPQFENQQGYFPYDLTHQEFISPRFGEVTPSMHLDTTPGDRIVVHDDIKTILNQINGNFLSTVNQYVDSFYVPLRSLYPTNYEKLLPNPTKGDDLPNAALPMVPFSHFVHDYINSVTSYNFYDLESDSIISISPYDVVLDDLMNWYSSDEPLNMFAVNVYVSRILLLATMLSRGQLLDYLGIAFDDRQIVLKSELQTVIDDLFSKTYTAFKENCYLNPRDYIKSISLNRSSNTINLQDLETAHIINIFSEDGYVTLSSFRNAISTAFERGELPYFYLDCSESLLTSMNQLSDSIAEFIRLVNRIFFNGFSSITDPLIYVSTLNSNSNPFIDGEFLNLTKCLAYQQIVAQYCSNNTVDNIFTSDLYMQLLRSVLFPATLNGLSSEPTFNYNGVQTEFDYMTSGAWAYSLLSHLNVNNEGVLNRQYIFITLMFLMRRSLRYGDYFATARPNMLAVGDLSINVSDGSVSPIDVTKNLLMQRYLNAVNYIGSGFMQYMASIYGVTPSDTGTFPRYIAHRKIPLQNQLTNNTADNQGYQTTNLVGYSSGDNIGFDVFIDDIGVIISLMSYDVLPVYTSGIDASSHLADRFDYFNPMLQNIGDQPIRLSEMVGYPGAYNAVFGYTMRNAEYKYKVSKAHGAFVNSLPGFMLRYPIQYREADGFVISPDFIRDSPVYLDPVVPQMTGISPAEYFHFIVSCTNQVKMARKIQATPSVLF